MAKTRYDQTLRAQGTDSLSLDEMRRRLPAIFAADKHFSRSERYVYIPTHDIIDVLTKEGFVPVEARVSRSRDIVRQTHAKHMIRFRRYDDSLKVGDTVFEVLLKNAHDGSGAYTFMAGLLKILCLNGMVAELGDAGRVHVRHSGNREKQLANVVQGAYDVLKVAPLALEAPGKWGGIELNRDEKLAFAEAARVVRFADSNGKVTTPIQADQLLIPRRYEDKGNDLWRVFNVVQENSVRGGLSAIGQTKTGQARKSTTRSVNGIDNDIKLNQALWVLADRLAKAKLGERALPVDAEFTPV